MPIFTVNDVALGYQEFGDREKRTIVLAHAIPFGSEVFNPLISELAENFHLVVLDIHGHGKSGYRTPLALEDMAEDFHQMLAALNLTNVIWVGYSIGGMIGLRLALTHPETIDSLVLIATAARLDPPWLREQTSQLWELFREGRREQIADAALQFFFAPATFKNQPELIERYKSKMINFNQSEGEALFEAASASLNRTDLSEQISAIKVPTLVIAGTKDIVAPPAEAEFIAEQIQSSEVKIFEDTSHLLVVEKPQEVAETISAFLKEKQIFVTN